MQPSGVCVTTFASSVTCDESLSVTAMGLCIVWSGAVVGLDKLTEGGFSVVFVATAGFNTSGRSVDDFGGEAMGLTVGDVLLL